MKPMKTETLDWLAALLSAFDVNWDEDFADDGYRDVWGRAPLVAEPRHPASSMPAIYIYKRPVASNSEK